MEIFGIKNLILYDKLHRTFNYFKYFIIQSFVFFSFGVDKQSSRTLQLNLDS